MTATSKTSWALRNYELIIVAGVLSVLLGSLAFLVIRLSAGSRDLAERRGIAAVDEHQASSIDVGSYQVALREVMRPYQMEPREQRMFVSEQRVWCVNCEKPIAYDATVCPYCDAEQPSDSAPVTLGSDSDRDGIPDWVEINYGLDPSDPADAQMDFDGDGFTNLSEYAAGTELDNPDSHPPHVSQLRVVRMPSAQFHMLFMGVNEVADGLRFQLNLRTLGQTRFARMGETITDERGRFSDVTVVEYDPDAAEGPTLYITLGEQRIGLVRGQPVEEADRRAWLVLLTDRTLYEDVSKNSRITVMDNEYELVEMGEDFVKVQSVERGYQVTVPMLTDAERWALRGRSEPDTTRDDEGFPARDIRDVRDEYPTRTQPDEPEWERRPEPEPRRPPTGLNDGRRSNEDIDRMMRDIVR